MKSPSLSSVFLLLYSLLPLLCAVNAAPAKEEKPCTIHDADGNFYDLRPLSASTDYTIKFPGGHNFSINVCKPLVQDVWNAKVPDPKKVAGILRRDHGDISVGEVNTTLSIFEKTPRLLLLNGSKCSKEAGDGATAATIIDFICDKSVYAAGLPHWKGQLPPDDEHACAFFLDWRTHLACPTGESGAMGIFASLLVTIVILLMIYLVLGTLYNRFVLGLTGFDQVPQFSFDSALYHAQNAWESLKDYVHGSKYHYPVPESSPGLGGVASRGVRSGLDGARRVFGRATGGGGGGQGQVNSFSHQAQVRTQNQSPAQSRSGEYERPAGGVSAAPTGTNPVSHQSQVMSAPVSASSVAGSHNPTAASAVSPVPVAGTASSTTVQPPAGKKNEEFILDQDEDDDEDGDDDEDDDEEESSDDGAETARMRGRMGDQGQGQGPIRL